MQITLKKKKNLLPVSVIGHAAEYFIAKSISPMAFLTPAQVFGKTAISPKLYKILLDKIHFQIQNE